GGFDSLRRRRNPSCPPAGRSKICTPPCTPGSRCTGYCPESSLSALLLVRSCSILSLDVAEKYFGLRDVRVGVADTGGKIIADVARHNARIAPVPRKADLVDHPAFDEKGLKAFGDQRVDLDGTPRAADDHLVAVLDPFALGQRRADLNESVGDEAYKPGHVAAHGAGLPVFGNPVGCGDDGEDIGFAVPIKFAGLPDLGTGTRL